jgi:hypothetical protein
MPRRGRQAARAKGGPRTDLGGGRKYQEGILIARQTRRRSTFRRCPSAPMAFQRRADARYKRSTFPSRPAALGDTHGVKRFATATRAEVRKMPTSHSAAGGKDHGGGRQRITEVMPPSRPEYLRPLCQVRIPPLKKWEVEGFPQSGRNDQSGGKKLPSIPRLQRGRRTPRLA